ncbi:MAG: DUF1178 family protein [Alphaproteobacteria bacterium]|nr:MAG: DUF1178 family protein [Alphaproteobacteria bacterium]
MIVFDLKCPHDHRFEAWFRSSAAYEEQCVSGAVECPYCGSIEISKAPMAPNVAAKGNTKPEPRRDTPKSVMHSTGDARLAEMAGEVQAIMERMRAHVEENCDYVGNRFADEARKIHYGETEERGIYGETTSEETRALMEEGIDVLPLPIARRTNA